MTSLKKIKILVATHKDYKMPNSKLYLPIFVGAKISDKNLTFQRDDDGKNISEKNPYFCELTALYWAWKNPEKIDADYIGLAHYRRHFTLKKSGKTPEKRLEAALTISEAETLLEKNEIILPKPRKYYIENLYDHYIHTMEAVPILKTEKIIKKDFPEFYPEFEKLKKRTSAHMFNMFIMKKEIFNDYCEWLFNILFELEKEMDKKTKKYDPFQARFYGRISELLLDVYLNTKKLNYVEIPIVDIEGVNWLKKSSSFLKAKFLRKKYDKSF